MTRAALAAMTMLSLACQPIAEEPDAGPPVNHPPRIVEGGETPLSAHVDGVLQSSTSPSTLDCANGLNFSVGSVEDDDIDQTLEERWVLDYDPAATTPDLGETIPLRQLGNQPAIRTDGNPGFVVTHGQLVGWDPANAPPAGAPHTVDVFISDGFDTVGTPGKPLKPTDTLPGFTYLQHTWVIVMSQACKAATP